MNVLLVGSGGREHALAWKLRQSPRLQDLYAMPGSAAIGSLASCIAGDPLDASVVVQACKEHGIGLVVVGPEAPLAAGLCDQVRSAGILAFGPGREAARLEASKAFAKAFMFRHRIPTADAEVFDDYYRAREAVAKVKAPVVVKADGLAAGKGVRVCRTRREALDAVRDFMDRGVLGDSGRRVVLEGFLQGPEITVMAFCDGHALTCLPFSRDHKRLGDADTGPNTGGMGAFAPVSLDAGTRRLIQEELLPRILQGMRSDGLEYRGILYCGLMLTESGPRVLEFNVRFGDPETQAVLPLLKTDLLSLMSATAEGRLEDATIGIGTERSVCVVMAGEGYPEAPKTGHGITGLEGASGPGVQVFHSGTARRGKEWVTAGGRVLSVSCAGKTFEEARTRAYEVVARIHFQGRHFRKDIAEESFPVEAGR